jgi:hypothetical protein
LAVFDPAKSHAIGVDVVALANLAKIKDPRVKGLTNLRQYVLFRHKAVKLELLFTSRKHTPFDPKTQPSFDLRVQAVANNSI